VKTSRQNLLAVRTDTSCGPGIEEVLYRSVSNGKIQGHSASWAAFSRIDAPALLAEEMSFFALIHVTCDVKIHIVADLTHEGILIHQRQLCHNDCWSARKRITLPEESY
jgi:hypothetical protein